MGFIGEIYQLINIFISFLQEAMYHICMTLPLVLRLIAIPLSVVILVACRLTLITWPVTIPIVLYIMLSNLWIRFRLKATSTKITKKFISYTNSNYPDIRIRKLCLYNNAISLQIADNYYTIHFEKDLNFDLSKFPKSETLYRSLADCIIQKYPLPDYVYVEDTTYNNASKKADSYYTAQTIAGNYEKNMQVVFRPVAENSHIQNIYREIIKKQPSFQFSPKKQGFIKQFCNKTKRFLTLKRAATRLKKSHDLF